MGSTNVRRGGLTIATKPHEKTIAQCVDELGILAPQIDELKAKQALAAVLTARIQEYSDKRFPANTGGCVEGHEYVAFFSAKGVKRTIRDMPRLSKILGIKNFLAACSFSLAKLDDLVPLAERDEILHEEQTGNRKLSVMRASIDVVKKKAA